MLCKFEVTFQATMPFVPRPRAALRLPWAKVMPPLRGCASAHSAALITAFQILRTKAYCLLPLTALPPYRLSRLVSVPNSVEAGFTSQTNRRVSLFVQARGYRGPACR